jgi:hypothetical protein
MPYFNVVVHTMVGLSCQVGAGHEYNSTKPIQKNISVLVPHCSNWCVVVRCEKNFASWVKSGKIFLNTYNNRSGGEHH